MSTGKILDNHIPVYMVVFQTQEVVLFRHAKTGEPLVGRPDAVESVNYAAVFARLEDELEDEVTGGWKLMEVRPSLPLPLRAAAAPLTPTNERTDDDAAAPSSPFFSTLRRHDDGWMADPPSPSPPPFGRLPPSPPPSFFTRPPARPPVRADGPPGRDAVVPPPLSQLIPRTHPPTHPPPLCQ